MSECHSRQTVWLCMQVDVASGAASALARLHQLDLAHPSLSPVNVLRSDNGNFKIKTFGWAKTCDVAVQGTAAGCINANFAYMAPGACSCIHHAAMLCTCHPLVRRCLRDTCLTLGSTLWLPFAGCSLPGLSSHLTLLELAAQRSCTATRPTNPISGPLLRCFLSAGQEHHHTATTASCTLSSVWQAAPYHHLIVRHGQFRQHWLHY
jgi:serine/threonine protein kinase